jgi:flagellar hook-length control protein FliK
MSAPVTPTAVRASTGAAASRPASRGSDPSPFASMLDDALSTGRGPSDRGIERRSSPDERAHRAVDHADRARDKADDRADRARDRAADRAAHHAERAERAAAHRAARAAGDAGPDDQLVDDVPTGDGDLDAAAPEPAGTTAPAETAGAAGAPVPGAVWAVLMGAAAPSPVATDTVATGDVSAPVGAVAAAGPADTPGTGAVALPAPTAPSAPAAGAPGATEGPATTTGTPGTAAPAATAGNAALDGFTVVRADEAPVPPTAPLQAAGLPGGTVTPVEAPVAPAPAATVPAEYAAVPADASVTGAVPAEPSLPAAAGISAAVTTPAPARPAGTPDSTPTTAPATAVTAATVTSGGEATSSGAGSSAGEGAADGGTTPTATPVVPGTSATSAPAAVAAAGDTDGATGASAAQPVGTQVARQVAVLRGGPDGAHTMTLVLTPDTLGPVEVQVTLQQGTVDLTLRGAHEHGRAALLDALPDLRRDLEAAGLTPSRLEVDRDSGGAWLDRHSAQQQGFGDRGDRQGRAEARSRSWSGPADTRTDGVTSPTNRSTSSGVDYRV